MAATYAKAKEYMDKVVSRLQQYFPEGFIPLHSDKLSDARNVFVIENQTAFKMHISKWYNQFFKISVGEELSDEELVEICPGFTTPKGLNKRMLYVQEDAEDGTLVHEFLHWLQHPNFYPTFYITHAKGSPVLEGVTEYFTRQVYSGVDRLHHYDRYYFNIVRGLAGQLITEQQIAAVAFKGTPVPSALTDLF